MLSFFRTFPSPRSAFGWYFLALHQQRFLLIQSNLKWMN
jgi:hypothetical protein